MPFVTTSPSFELDATTKPPGHMQKVYTPLEPDLPVSLYSAAPSLG